MGDFELKFAFFCDDVRREDNGKSLIIGAMAAGVISAKTFPVTKRFLSAFVVAEMSSGKFEMQYQLVKKAGKTPIRDGSLGFEYTGKEELDVLPIDFGIDLSGTVFETPGEYHLKLRIADGRWKTGAKMTIVSHAD